MQIIQHNPYRTLGLLVGATASEQRRQTTRLQRFIEADLEPEEDFSFPILGEFTRTVDLVNDAESMLNLNSDKMNAALFWFYKGNPITDEPAFDAIRLGDINVALNIWTNLVSNGEISERNASAYNNLATLYLSGVLNDRNTSKEQIEQGVLLKIQFLDSDFANNLKELATDETLQITKKELQLQFLNKIQTEIEKSNVITLYEFLDIISERNFIAKDDFLKKIAQQPIEEIERSIEELKSKRKVNKDEAIEIGKTLLKQTSDKLKLLKTILGKSNLSYSSIADKVANEVLQCSIEFNNNHQKNNSDFDYIETALKLAKSTEAIAVGKLTKDRIKDTLNTLENNTLYHICYFCCKNIAIRSATYRRILYKGSYEKYQYIITRTPRCKHCEEIQERGSIWFLRIPMIVFPILMISLRFTATIVGDLILGLMLGLMLGLLASYSLSSIETSLKIKIAKIKKESAYKEFDPIKKLINEGWTTERPTR